MPPDGSRWTRILHSDLAAAWVLVAAVAVALVWANGSWAHTYDAVWLQPARVGGRAFDGFTTVRDWVNGGLMAVFFLVVGLEIGRERRHGDLADARTAVVPVAGALGGMAGAGLVYAAVTHGGPGSSGWGIPMATDIAFALGALALLGRRVPTGPAGVPADPGRGRRHRLGGRAGRLLLVPHPTAGPGRRRRGGGGPGGAAPPDPGVHRPSC